MNGLPIEILLIGQIGIDQCAAVGGAIWEIDVFGLFSTRQQRIDWGQISRMFWNVQPFLMKWIWATNLIACIASSCQPDRSPPEQLMRLSLAFYYLSSNEYFQFFFVLPVDLVGCSYHNRRRAQVEYHQLLTVAGNRLDKIFGRMHSMPAVRNNMAWRKYKILTHGLSESRNATWPAHSTSRCSNSRNHHTTPYNYSVAVCLCVNECCLSFWHSVRKSHAIPVYILLFVRNHWNFGKQYTLFFLVVSIQKHLSSRTLHISFLWMHQFEHTFWACIKENPNSIK